MKAPKTGTELYHWALRRGGCDAALTWLRKHGEKDAKQLWQTCDRGDWLIWLVNRVVVQALKIKLANDNDDQLNPSCGVGYRRATSRYWKAALQLDELVWRWGGEYGEDARAYGGWHELLLEGELDHALLRDGADLIRQGITWDELWAD